MHVQATACFGQCIRHLVQWLLLCGGSFFIAFSGTFHVDANQSFGVQQNAFSGNKSSIFITNQDKVSFDIFFNPNVPLDIGFYNPVIKIKNYAYNPNTAIFGNIDPTKISKTKWNVATSGNFSKISLALLPPLQPITPTLKFPKKTIKHKEKEKCIEYKDTIVSFFYDVCKSYNNFFNPPPENEKKKQPIVSNKSKNNPTNNPKKSTFYCISSIFCNNVADTKPLQIRENIEKEAIRSNPPNHVVKTNLSWQDQYDRLFNTTWKANDCIFDQEEPKCFHRYISTYVYFAKHDNKFSFDKCNRVTDCIVKILHETARNKGYVLGTCYEPKDRLGLQCIAKNKGNLITFFSVDYE